MKALETAAKIYGMTVGEILGKIILTVIGYGALLTLGLFLIYRTIIIADRKYHFFK